MGISVLLISSIILTYCKTSTAISAIHQYNEANQRIHIPSVNLLIKMCFEGVLLTGKGKDEKLFQATYLSKIIRFLTGFAFLERDIKEWTSFVLLRRVNVDVEV